MVTLKLVTIFFIRIELISRFSSYFFSLTILSIANIFLYNLSLAPNCVLEYKHLWQETWRLSVMVSSFLRCFVVVGVHFFLCLRISASCMFCSLKFASDNCGEEACATEGSKASPRPGSHPQVGLNTEERTRATSLLTSSHLPQSPSHFSFLLTWSSKRVCFGLVVSVGHLSLWIWSHLLFYI